MSNLLRCLVEDKTMSRDDIEKVSVFYGDWDSADITRERQLLFARLKRMEGPISITKICKQSRENRQRWALPQICKLQIPVSICGFANLISYRKYLRICGKKTEIYRKSARQ